MNNYSAYERATKEGFMQLLAHLLPKLPYRSIGEAIWAMREMPLVDDRKAVEWILEYCQPTIVCYENIDTECPKLVYNHPEYSDMKEGEVIALVRQDFPKENGIYVYTGDTTPLSRVNTDVR